MNGAECSATGYPGVVDQQDVATFEQGDGRAEETGYNPLAHWLDPGLMD